VGGIALAVGPVYLFVHATGALQLPAGSAPAAVVAAADRALVIVSMLLGGMVAMMAGFTVQDRTAGGQVSTAPWRGWPGLCRWRSPTTTPVRTPVPAEPRFSPGTTARAGSVSRP
jgi:hypothetical protein